MKSYKVIFWLGIRYLYGRSTGGFARFLSLLTTLGMIIGVAALIIVLSVMNGFQARLSNLLLDYIPHAVVTTTQGYMQPEMILKQQLATLPSVTNITPLVMEKVILQSAQQIDMALLLGIDPQQHEPLSAHFMASNIPFSQVLQPGKYQIIVSVQLAEKLGLNIGDRVRITVPHLTQFTPFGMLPQQRIFTLVGTFHTGVTEVDSKQFFTHYIDAAKLLRYPPGAITGWRLFLADPFMIDQLVSQPLPQQVIWRDWREQQGIFFKAVKLERNIMTILMSSLITIAAFSLFVSLSLTVIYKRREIAILQTLGLTRTALMMTFTVFGLLTGLLGSVIGTLLGLLLCHYLDSITPLLGALAAQGPLPLLIIPQQIALIALFVLLISIATTLYPAWRGSAIAPAEALRYE